MIGLLLFITLTLHCLFSNRYYFRGEPFSRSGFNVFLFMIYVYVTFFINFASVYLLMISVVLVIDLVYFYGIKKSKAHFKNNTISYLNITMVLIVVPLIQPTVLLFTQ